jgi:hypothetical protein
MGAGRAPLHLLSSISHLLWEVALPMTMAHNGAKCTRERAPYAVSVGLLLHNPMDPLRRLRDACGASQRDACAAPVATCRAPGSSHP